jgi:penicillin-binding protein 1C
VPTVACPFHLSLDVDEKTGQALPPACRAGHHYRRQVFLTWPASIRRWLQGEHLALPEAPAFAPECVQGGALSPPTITNPPAGQIAFLIPGLAADRQEIPLEAESRDLSGRLSWFVDGEFLGRFPAENRVWWTPRPGLHDIVVTDQNGLSDRRSLEVRQAK